MKIRTSPVIAVLLAMSMIAVSFARSSQTPKNGGQTAAMTDSGWPRTIVSGETTILFYQPQIAKWEGNQIKAFAAVAVKDGGERGEVYGVVYFTARTEVDKVNRLVTLQDFHITKADFPSAPEKAEQYADIIQRDRQDKVKTISYDRLIANLEAGTAQQKGAGYELNNQPPRIIFSTRPAILVPIDGQPVLRPLAESGMERVINTRALMVFYQKRNTYYLYLMNGWVQSPTPEGPWTFADSVPSEVKKVKDKLESSGQVDLLNGQNTGEAEPAAAVEKQESLKDRLKNGTFPVIYVATTPAELLISDGEPQFTPIPETGLLYVANSNDDIFMNTTDQDYYVLISGRWFKARSMDGPWQYVAASDLPEGFGKIPEDHAKASVLASVPGTTAAQEALVADQVPQTATITRDEAALTVEYDGEPQFRAIEGTALKYAVNTATPVIEVGPSRFCAVENGVWFIAGSPEGPWSVATSVPSVIYSIPPSCPIYYVTYVRVYGYTDDVVYCGYTPGYYGTVLSTDGIIVYGTGWYYPPYIGRFWFGWPWTYGCGGGFSWSPWWGWSFDFGIGYYFPFWRPWWGPLGRAWRWHRWGPRWGWGRFGGVAGLNVYGRWGRSAFVRTRAAWASPRAGDTSRSRFGRTGVAGRVPRIGPRPGAPRQPTGRPGVNRTGPGVQRPPRQRPPVQRPPAQRPQRPVQRPPVQRPPGGVRPVPGVRHGNEVFAGNDGKVYRYDERNRTWQQRNGKDWRTPSPSFDRRALDRTRQMRQQGNERWNNFPGRSSGTAGRSARPGGSTPRPSRSGSKPGGGRRH